MRILSISSIVLLLVFGACKGANEPENKRSANDSSDHVASSEDKEIKQVTPAFQSMDAKVSAYFKELTDDYLNIKNGLASDDGKVAASAAAAFVKTFEGIDKSYFPTDQRDFFNQNASELKEHAEHIADKSDDIKHQRSHFMMMSEDMYVLIKAFGAGKPIYHDHCPMARDNKGAMWLSEQREIRNPYFGSGMLNCGTVEEIIQQ